MDIRLNTIEEAIEDIKPGKVIIVVDDEDRENEGKEAINTEVNADIVKMLFGVGYDRAYTVPEVAEKYDMSEEDVIAIKNATIKYMRQERKKYKIAI